jgi:hypothetical protein
VTFFSYIYVRIDDKNVISVFIFTYIIFYLQVFVSLSNISVEFELTLMPETLETHST